MSGNELPTTAAHTKLHSVHAILSTYILVFMLTTFVKRIIHAK